MSKERIVFMQCIDFTPEEMKQLRDAIMTTMPSLPYRFIVTSKIIESMSLKDLQQFAKAILREDQ